MIPAAKIKGARFKIKGVVLSYDIETHVRPVDVKSLYVSHEFLSDAL
jgi:hypothetical protein